ncbi:MarR family winged helix-turn-helix transcriptional regulator [Deinococcus alpinitundrae]|uniref:MarR family winged helix-turn-helix transcriptional regulator n=1 Tax=Deinococcus alpinitundrae TaxID=468913 RepID=UPI001379DDFD|nr:MarR family transcriptional regulator [Deinococcus alpinitundrae]
MILSVQKNAFHQPVTSNLDPPHCAAPDHDPNDPAERLTVCMQQLHRLVSDRIMGTLQSELQGEDVSFTQMTALYKVRAFAPIRLTLLSEHLGVSLPATSQLIQELVRRELMERRENPENRREKLLALSDKGQQFLSVREKAMMGAYREVFGQVNPETITRAEQAITALISEADALRASNRAQPARPQPNPPQPTPHQETP